ncbi:MAG TPA: 2-C-methyl-D-erythritol 4-phosphate cytidylyltransferase [Vicinamibacterales bacterium]|nr:2-C-methyl-D-erythritol 4-phosphate cytidylyltransferase [Vicinamibacterales bacterium]HPK70632.1 2-C-methyl-D-erythritol 4-phosphate cytidylyltransferase [Vicinamibacterales bacterium]
MRVAAIIAAGGRGERLGAGVPKQLLPVGGVSILARSVEIFAGHDLVDEIVVVLPAELAADPPAGLHAGAKPLRVVAGGARRQDSVRRGFEAVAGRADLVVIHDAARPFASLSLVTRVIEAAEESGAALAAVAASDTVKLAREDAAGGAVVERTLPRARIHLAQTPQAFRTEVLAAAIEAGRGIEATDEAALAEAAGFPVRLVPGEASNMKITTMTDLTTADAVAGGPGARVGAGYDLHRLVEGRPLVLGGVTIPFDRGLAGHSDADVAAHAVTDAVLGAIAGGDIGRHFPDADPRWKGASSLAMLAHAAGVARDAGFEVVNVDVVIVAERPKIAPYADAIRAGLAGALGIAVARVSVKGKTNEGLDAVGRGEAMAAHAVALVSPRG